MGATYTRQSSYTDGDVIQAADTNDEFNQLLAAFASSTGHTHDGTTAEGGPVTKLLGTGITIGDGTSGTDITVTFDGETNDGELKWMEDEDYFEFSDDILVASTEKIQFRDTAIYINSSTDGQLDLVADTEIQIAATTIDINGAVDVSGNLSVGGNLDVTGTLDLSDSDFTNVGDIQLDSISGDGDTNTSITFSGSDVITITTGGETQFTFNNGSILPTTDNDIDLGSASYEFKDGYFDGTLYADAINFDGTAISATAAELNILDGVTATTAELNYSDTGAAVGTVVASKVVTVDSNKDVASFRNITLTGELDAGSLDISGDADIDGTLEADAITIGGTAIGSLYGAVAGSSSIVTTGALDSGSITSGFGSIDTGSSAITTTGLISGGSLDIDDVVINGSTIGHTDDTDLITVANGVVTVAGEISVTTLDIGGTNVTSTAAELNLIDGDTARGTTAVASGDGILINDGGTMRMTNVDTVSTYFSSHNVGGSNIVTTGALDSGSITSGFGNIDNGSSTITTTGLITGGSLDIDDVVINGTTIGHTDDTDLITLTDGVVTVAGEISMTTLDIGGTNVTSTAAELNILDGATATATELNLLDGDTSVGGSITLADSDGFVVNDGGTMKTIPASDVKTYAAGSAATKGFAIAAAIVFG
tara:strand:+ start:3568 stop:5529 length:1962 start_codon:yes stop_codon:yes gene_type:complete